MQYDEPWYWVGWRIFMTHRGYTKIRGCRDGEAATTMTRAAPAAQHELAIVETREAIHIGQHRQH